MGRSRASHCCEGSAQRVLVLDRWLVVAGRRDGQLLVRRRRRHHEAARGARQPAREAGEPDGDGDPRPLHRRPGDLHVPAGPPRARGADQDLRCAPPRRQRRRRRSAAAPPPLCSALRSARPRSLCLSGSRPDAARPPRQATCTASTSTCCASSSTAASRPSRTTCSSATTSTAASRASRRSACCSRTR